MSLIKCPECNKEISNKSTYCIHCGFPLDSLKTKCVIDGKEYDLSKTKSILESNNPQIEEIKKSLADEIGTNNLIYFKVTFLDCSPFNRKELGDMYLKACQYGVPMVSYYCASQGLSQSEMDCMNFLENEVLNIKSTFIPLQSSSTQSSDGNGATQEGGAPQKDIDELSESGEQNREDA